MVTETPLNTNHHRLFIIPFYNRVMKAIIIPGFWDTALEIGLTAEALKRHGEKDVIVLDYADFKDHGERFNRDSFFKLMDTHVGDHAEEYTFIGYSMGAGFVYDYLLRKKIIPQKLVVIDPLLQKLQMS